MFRRFLIRPSSGREFFVEETVQFIYTNLLLILPLALQPTVGFGLSHNIVPFFAIYQQLSLHILTPST